MPSNSNARMSEEQLRALSRREIQALAKKEKIKPANATSEKLIKRLLAKFFGSAKRLKPKTKRSTRSGTPDFFQPVLKTTEPKPSTSESSLPDSPTLNSAAPSGCSTVEPLKEAPAPAISVVLQAPISVVDSVALDATVSLQLPVSTPPAVGSSIVGHRSTLDPVPMKVDPEFLSVQSIHVDRESASSQPFSPSRADPLLEPPLRTEAQTPAVPPNLNYPVECVHPSYPAHPFPCPTMDHLIEFHEELFDLSESMLEIPQALEAMDRLLPVVQRTAEEAAQMLKEVAWQGYYFERDFLSQMKHTQMLWDGTNVMPPGEQRYKWYSFIDEVNKEYDRLEYPEVGDQGGLRSLVTEE